MGPQQGPLFTYKWVKEGDRWESTEVGKRKVGEGRQKESSGRGGGEGWNWGEKRGRINREREETEGERKDTEGERRRRKKKKRKQQQQKRRGEDGREKEGDREREEKYQVPYPLIHSASESFAFWIPALNSEHDTLSRWISYFLASCPHPTHFLCPKHGKSLGKMGLVREIRDSDKHLRQLT